MALAFSLVRSAPGGGEACVAVAVAAGGLAPADGAEDGAHDTSAAGLHEDQEKQQKQQGGKRFFCRSALKSQPTDAFSSFA